MAKICVIDDEENIRKTLKDILEDEAHDVVIAEDGIRGLKVVADESPDVVLLDIQMPGKDGLTLLKEIKEQCRDCEIIMISGHGTIESAVKAIKMGAYHFLQKPLSMIEIKQIVGHAALAKAQRDEITAFRQDAEARYRMIGSCAAIRKVQEEIGKVAPTLGRVLITGESGSGKELVAYAIHQRSPRKEWPFIKVNCAAIPQNLIESELFGHEKGAFTGAVATKKGKFELAHRGTLFLDEIGDMDMNTQTRVLRVIQEGEFEHVGGTKTIKVDVRIIAATHRNLQAMVEAGSFRQDLFYRLNVVPLHVPSLSQRIEDIPALAQWFLDNYCKESGIKTKTLSPQALELLTRLKYAGNVRELKNIVERVAIMTSENEITDAQVKMHVEIRENTDNSVFFRPIPLARAKDELERMYVKIQLDVNGWDIPKTAALLDIQRTNLHRKIRQLGIEKG